MTLSAVEVFEMAARMEHGAVQFYRAAAEVQGSTPVATALSALAEWEEAHEQAFRRMVAELSAREEPDLLGDPEGEPHRYLQVVAGGRVLGPLADPLEWLAGTRTVDDILRKALQLEKDSIILYLGILRFASEAEIRDQLDRIIEQEMEHVRLIGEMLEGPA